MPLICKDCPNKERFERLVYGSEVYSEVEYLDEGSNTRHYGDREYRDSEIDDSDPIKCSSCESHNIEEVYQEEWDSWNGPNSDNPEEKKKGESWKDFMRRRNK